MNLIKNEFEQKYNDTIAVVYRILRHLNRDEIEIVKKEVIRLNPLYNNYLLDKNGEYLIVCGRSEYKYENDTIKKIFPKSE